MSAADVRTVPAPRRVRRAPRSTASTRGIVLSGVRRLRARYTALAVVLALSTAASVFGALIGTYAAGQSAGSAEGTAALRTIAVYAEGKPITEDSLAAFRRLPGVASSTAFVRVPVGMRSTGADLSLIGLTADNQPPLVLGKITPAMIEPTHGDGAIPGIVLPATIGTQDFREYVGRKVELTYTVAVDAESGVTRTREFEVTGVSDPTYQVDALNAAYIAESLAKELYYARLGIEPSQLADVGGFEKATVTAVDQGSVSAVTELLQADGYQAVSRIQELDSVPGVITLIRVAGAVLAGGLLLVSAICAFVLTASLARQRTRELGILRTVGWSSRRVLAAWTGEVAVVALGAVLLGTAAGIAAGLTLGDSLREHLADGQLGVVELNPLAVVGVPTLFLLLAVVPAALVILRHSKRDVVSVLRVV